MKTSSRYLVLVGGLGLTLLASACALMSGSGRAGDPRMPTVKSVVAVTEFENRAGFKGQWELGSGMADLLTVQLIESGRFTVLERQRVQSVFGELMMQGRHLFRPEGRVASGRLKNARYLIRGAITDFTVTGDASGWFAKARGRARGRGSRARVALVLTVLEVESGEILAAVNASGRASSRAFGVDVQYPGMAFGGDVFFQTPLGKATERALAEALRKLQRALPPETWQPQVAEGGPDSVVVNGGHNVHVRPGDRFLVREPGREITDPVTGNVIETFPGRVIGRLRIVSVGAQASYAVLEEGRAARGDILEHAGR